MLELLAVCQRIPTYYSVFVTCLKLIPNVLSVCQHRVLTNSKFGLFYSNFLILTPTFSKVPIEKYGKTPFFSGKQHFYSYFQNPSENSATYLLNYSYVGAIHGSVTGP